MRLPTLSKSCILVNLLPADALARRRLSKSHEVKLENVYGMCRRRRRGAAAVEFAIVAPLFFMLVLGMIEIGRMVMVQQIITNASREGARVAVLDPAPGGTTRQDVLDKVTGYLTAANIHGASITITPTEPSTATYGQPVTVSVSVPTSAVSWIPRPRFSGEGRLFAGYVRYAARNSTVENNCVPRQSLGTRDNKRHAREGICSQAPLGNPLVFNK